MATSLAKAFAKLQQATAQLAERGLKDPEEAVSGATDYLRLFGHVVMGMDVVDAIAGVPLGGPGPFPGRAPLMPIVITKVAPVN